MRAGSPVMLRTAVCRVLRRAVAERPVLLLDLDEVDEDVVRPDADRRRESIRDGLIERFLLLGRTAPRCQARVGEIVELTEWPISSSL